MSNKFRREAAVLAAYLAQYDDTELATAGTDRLRRDYQQTLRWTTAAQPSTEDIAALALMRRHYGFPPTV